MPRDRYIEQTRMLDFESVPIKLLIQKRGWSELANYDRIAAAYNFVRNEIAFGYNRNDTITASRVLADGYGQCNTKATLLMALLRALGISCRLHGFTIDKHLQRGVVPELVYPIAPDNILHSWVEVELEGRWLNLEGFILDDKVLKALQVAFPERNSLCAYGAGTDNLQSPNVEWQGDDTYIQKTGINNDFGVFDSPDDFYAAHSQDLKGLKGIFYRLFVRHWMNARVAAVRNGHIPAIPEAPGTAKLSRGSELATMSKS